MCSVNIDSDLFLINCFPWYQNCVCPNVLGNRLEFMCLLFKYLEILLQNGQIVNVLLSMHVVSKLYLQTNQSCVPYKCNFSKTNNSYWNAKSNQKLIYLTNSRFTDTYLKFICGKKWASFSVHQFVHQTESRNLSNFCQIASLPIYPTTLNG